MRQNPGGSNWSATVTLIVALVVAFILQRFVVDPAFTAKYAVLSFDGIRHGFIWQFLTFQFLHSGWIHLLLNCLVIYTFGRAIEWELGRVRFLTLYFLSGIAGGFLQTLGSWFLPTYLGGGVVGASAGAFGLLAAFAMRNPERELTMLLYFVVPIRMRAKTLLVISTILAVLGVALPFVLTILKIHYKSDDIAHAAHLGGLIMGVLWIRLGWHHDYVRLPWEGWFDRLRDWRPIKMRKRPRGAVKGTLNPLLSTTLKTGDTDLPAEEFISREVDPILDKISEHGIQSLTERERHILNAARKRMAKR